LTSTENSKNSLSNRESSINTVSTPTARRTKPLASPHRNKGLPESPYKSGSDAFWDQVVINSWVDKHSPKKILSEPKASSEKARSRSTRDARKSFEERKNRVAEAFLDELDQVITQGQLKSLTVATGGVKIRWTNKLNTTAGKANWRRETVRCKAVDGVNASTTHKHHASIELAEKVISDENRLLNVIAHEFCHLANFMISGITGNPHGKEFKLWAAKCSAVFGDRGINVTTKHSYDIDFKYIWECTACGVEYKRHSKSIKPEQHRCGACKSMLKQTKPVPRTPGKTSEYQKFMKQQMKMIRSENPGGPQKEVMRLIAERWHRQGLDAQNSAVSVDSPDSIVAALEVLKLNPATEGVLRGLGADAMKAL
jgi:predicted SprT family Zn-dependent metalloprotease